VAVFAALAAFTVFAAFALFVFAALAALAAVGRKSWGDKTKGKNGGHENFTKHKFLLNVSAKYLDQVTP
jgi:hypothetical protein